MKQSNLVPRAYQTGYLSQLLQHGLRRLHIDMPLFIGLLLLMFAGLFILYSASNENLTLVSQQVVRLVLAIVVMLIFAQIHPSRYKKWAPWIFGIGFVLLLFVLVVGAISKGAQRWLNLGLFSFQPSEIMKLAVPIVLSWYLSEEHLPPSWRNIIVCSILVIAPVMVIIMQPDLGTALIIAISGILVLLLAGISWRLVGGVTGIIALSLPIAWHFMHIYQKARVLTFLKPERDPLGSGYHIIQSKIAIGSGGFFGKGWLNGTQSHLHFLPENATDFIFGVCGEELGFIGCIILLAIFVYIVGRGLYICNHAQDTFSRLLAGSLTLTFFISFFVNIGMVIGILPVVGLPLPLVSYGGTSMVTLMAGFGVIMSIHTHRQLLAS